MILFKGPSGRGTSAQSRVIARVAILSAALAALLLLPAGRAAADSSRFDRSGVAMIFDAAASQGGKVKVVEAETRKNVPDRPGVFFQLGNFQAVKLDASGKLTRETVGTFQKPLSLTIHIPKAIMDKLTAGGVTQPTLYFWDPESKGWQSVSAGKHVGKFSFRDYQLGPWFRGRSITVLIDSWPADDPACGFGG